MSFEVRINGVPFVLWQSASLVRSIDTNSGVFNLINSSTTPLREYPLKAGDFIELIVDKMRMIAGFIDDFLSTNYVDNRQVSIPGRDNTQDLIDSSVPDSAKVTEGPVSLKKLCENVIAALGAEIEVLDKVGGLADFTSEDLQSAGSGESCMAYLVNFARKRQVYLVSDGNANLLIYRPDESNKASVPLVHRRDNPTNNVLESSSRRSQQNRFARVVCRSQDNFGFNDDADYSSVDGFTSGINREGEAKDSQIRSSRYLEFQAEESMTDDECPNRAAEEVNIRRAQAQEYTAKVQGNSQPDGTVWDFGQFIDVDDEYEDVRGEFLIKTVTLAEDLRGGSTATLVCVSPDAYQVIAEPTKETQRKSSTGTAFQEAEPQSQNTSLRS